MAETITQYESAAVERLYDGLAVATTKGREESGGSVYLFGHVIESVLKSAFFRLAKWSLDVPVDLRHMAESLGRPRLAAGESHDLGLLWQVLHTKRTVAGLPLHADASERSRRASSVWSVGMRYDGRPLSHEVVMQMFDDAARFYANRFALVEEKGKGETTNAA